ncbi:DUF4221 domain-containing protein [Parabacteroides goldsteinii]|uniref:DUF4221 family protein n=1 Tax=Parabacteroides goldsteinii TaxID=328812 RepID=UPI001CCD7A50|nr:DUF4221 family protein [Parabacteroides goldsteinii]UBD73734.1 DUF4221 domain-containing protein [Parabacteroides goldsteinii]
MYKKWYYVCFIFILVSCSHDIANIKNAGKGKLKANYQLVTIEEKKFQLDSETAPRPVYTQMFKDESGTELFTFFNSYNKSIYIYDYLSSTYIKSIHYDNEGANGILHPIGYYIKNMDSIFVYDMMKIEVALTDSSGFVRDRISLKNSTDNNWALYYPQYSLSTINPFIERQGRLILTGFAPFAIPSENIDNFLFTVYIDLKTKQIEYHHKYPKALYGCNYNWEGGFATMVYPCLSHDEKLIFSFPVSHDLFFYDFKSENLTKLYAGSNFANTIHSIDHEQRRTPNELIMENYMQEDMYGAILYDPYRKMYYRFLLQGMPDAAIGMSTGEKPVDIIIMDENFNYLGETTIGVEKEWNWTNSFVTLEGLNIEYISGEGIDEDYLTFKIFIPKVI